MTVKELIEKLKDADPSAEAQFVTYDGDVLPVGDVDIDDDGTVFLEEKS